MTDQIPQEIKHQRVARLSEVAREACSKALDRKVGCTDVLLTEGYQNGAVHGHTPDFCEVTVPLHRPPETDLLPIRILSHNGLTCQGEPI
jgi:tRNA A37 methylthiotransferase MiaB